MNYRDAEDAEEALGRVDIE